MDFNTFCFNYIHSTTKCNCISLNTGSKKLLLKISLILFLMTNIERFTKNNIICTSKVHLVKTNDIFQF